MTEQKTIWHDKEDFMFYKSIPMKMDNKHIIVHLVIDDVDYWDMILCGEKELNSEAVQYIKKWSYLNDLLEQSNKVERLESEASRYKVALEKTKEVLIENTPNGDTLLEETIHFITQALEKESK